MPFREAINNYAMVYQFQSRRFDNINETTRETRYCSNKKPFDPELNVVFRVFFAI